MREQLSIKADNTNDLLFKVYNQSTDLCKQVSIELLWEFQNFCDSAMVLEWREEGEIKLKISPDQIPGDVKELNMHKSVANK